MGNVKLLKIVNNNRSRLVHMLSTPFLVSLQGPLRRVLHRLRWLTHPVTIFVALQIVWLAITLIWVIWFVGQQELIADMARRLGQEYFSPRVAVAVLIVGCVLLGVLLFGTIMLFVFGQQQSYQARQHRNFISSVTHELKSPLASLQLAFETMTSHQLPPEIAAKVAAMIDTDITRLRRLIDQILVAARLQRSVMAFDEERQAVRLQDVLSRVAAQATYLDAALDHRLTIACPAGLEVKTSRAAISLVATNLLENAIKYSPPGHPIQMGVRVDPATQSLILWVKDHGIGLSRSDQRRVFRLFHRGETAVRKAIPGTGLGLFIVKSVVMGLGGRAFVESPGPGLGATFSISLPFDGRYAADASTLEDFTNG